jgi:hypothetical protein
MDIELTANRCRSRCIYERRLSSLVLQFFAHAVHRPPTSRNKSDDWNNSRFRARLNNDPRLTRLVTIVHRHARAATTAPK